MDGPREKPPETEPDEPEEGSPGAESESYRELPVTREDDRRWGAEVHHSWGDLDEKHWTKVRGDRNEEVLEYYRERSKAPGVAEGGAERNHYCMQCDGVIPLSYFQNRPAGKTEERCPHCGAELEGRIRRMFNWVEIDQPHDGDLKVLLPPLLFAVVVLLGVAALAWRFLS